MRVSICTMIWKCVLLDEDNAGKIPLEVELVMPIWKFGSGLHLISILPKLLTNYDDGGGIWCFLIKLEFTFFFININFSFVLRATSILWGELWMNKVTTHWEGPQSLSYHKQWLAKMGYCIFKLVQANSHTQQEYELIVLFRNWDTISRFGTSMCWTPITALTPS